VKVLDHKEKWHEYIHNCIIFTHLACMFILMGTIFKNLNLTAMDAHVFLKYFLILAVLFIGESALIYFFRRNEIDLKDPKITFTDVLYILFPLAIAIAILLINHTNPLDIKVVLLIPVLIAGSLKGKKTAYFFASVCTLIIVLFDIINGTNSIVCAIQDNFVLMSLTFLVGWFSGSISEFELEYRKHLTNLANTDNLTKLFNHRYLQERLIALFKGADFENPLSLIMIDIDDFKLFNDTHGHQKGDDLLFQIGQIITKFAPHSGFAARYGGEEFVVVLPGLDSAKAVALAEVIRLKIDTQFFYGEEHQPAGKITISCGVATAPEYAKTPEELIQRADQALYRAKSLSKNRVELYSSVFEELLKTARGEEKNLINSFQTLLQVINAKDRYTYGHSERVMEYSVKLAGEINLPESDITLLRYAAFLHDIGKIEIDRNLLNKADILNDREFNTIQQHCRWGSEIIKAVPQLDKTTSIILHHHENYNGSGYPHGLSGESIPLLARIIRIADSYDAMTSNRPYRKAMSNDEALEEIKRCSGTMFDPKLVPHFLNIMPRSVQYAGSGSYSTGTDS